MRSILIGSEILAHLIPPRRENRYPLRHVASRGNGGKPLRSISGFSLIELVLTITIMGILTGIATLSFNSWQKKSAIEAETTQLFADFSEVRTKAFTQKKVYGIVFQPTSYALKSYSSAGECSTDANAASKGLTVSNKTLSYTLSKATGADISGTPVVFDTNGFVYNTTVFDVNNVLTIFVNPTTESAAVNCVVVSSARANVGRINGTACDLK